MIQRVTIKLFKAIKDFDENFKGNIILLKGDNEVGKTSVIQFIKIVLGETTNIPPAFEAEGGIDIELKGGLYNFSVTSKNGKPVITVTSPDGLKSNLKSAIANIVGATEFNIAEFCEQSKSKAGQKKQVETYKSFLDPEVIKGINALEQNIQVAYDQRTECGKDLKNIMGVISEHPLRNEIDLDSFKEVDTKEIFAKLQEATKTNDSIVKAENIIENLESQSKDLHNKLIVIQDEMKRIANRIDEGKDWLKKNNKIDVSEFETKLENANDINHKAQAAKVLKEAYLKKEELENMSGELTANIDSQRYEVATAIKDMYTPVEGLSFDLDTLYYQGIAVNPDSLSKSQMMELGVKMKIAENKALGVIFLEEGESIGQKRFEEICKLAKDNDMQLIMEQVERGNEKLTVEIVGG